MVKKKSKVFLLSRCDIDGGAAKAAYRLYKSLQLDGVDVEMIVDDKKSQDLGVKAPQALLQKIFIKVKSKLDLLPILLLYRLKPAETWGLSWFPFFSYLGNFAVKNKDNILHFHWISYGAFPLLYFFRLRKYKIFWTMHDMWALTGGCHYSGTCDRYLTGCGNCPQLKSNYRFDLSRLSFFIKKKIFSTADITVICCSEWLRSCFESSPMFQNKKIVCLPNPIDTDFFKPVDMLRAREVFNLPSEKFLILVSAMSATTNLRKGFEYIPKALNAIPANLYSHIELVVMGASENQKTDAHIPFPVHYLGTVTDERSLALAYSACDVSVAPSLQENLSNSVMESLACGTPVVAFAVGGMVDLIKNGQTGELSSEISSDALSLNLLKVFNNGKNFYTHKCREFVLKNYRSDIVAEKFRNVYFAQEKQTRIT